MEIKRRLNDRQLRFVALGVIAAFVLIVLLAVVATRRMAAASGSGTESAESASLTSEPEKPEEYEITLSGLASGEYVETSLKEKTAGSRTYLAEEGSSVALMCKLGALRYLSGASVDAVIEGELTEVPYSIAGNRVEFTMPEGNVRVRFYIANGSENTDSKDESADESRISYISETRHYDVKVEGLTEELRQRMIGKFNDDDFVNALGKALSLNDPMSAYRDVNTVTFTGEEGDSPLGNMVILPAYLNHDEARKITLLFNSEYAAYNFNVSGEAAVPVEPTPIVHAESSTEAAEAPETAQTVNESEEPQESPQSPQETHETAPEPTQAPTTAPTAAPEPQPEPQPQPQPQIVQETVVYSEPEASGSFGLDGIPNAFASQLRDQNSFFNQVYDYVYANYPSASQGNFGSYQVNGASISFTINLNTGNTIAGTYDINSGNVNF